MTKRRSSAKSLLKNGAGAPVTLPPAIRDLIGRELRAMYSRQLSEAPLPTRLRALADRLERAIQTHRGGPDSEFRHGLLAVIPRLRAYAISLTSNTDRADDLVQEAILRAWEKNTSFAPGTNLDAWLFTILRNVFYTEFRKRAREVEDIYGTFAARLATPAEQTGRLELQEVWSAFDRIPIEQREVLILVAAEGLSYEEAAEICGCAVGTIKSRVNRARVRLAELLGYSKGDFDSDRITQAALGG
jgi:RNA polymerase sigma-70 factor, ECF subfamily